ncbi:GNAT family N-acetyltransferase [Alkalicoccobacillus porphyridii]|uniref:GNAT family N-acetyltransferase n=1 Tax=Alkalicoccobacillus porphyridii TaxID=2597270 RepID=A0A553ZTP6_9BACI|nr:GNAT family N-acetyltransferase [Alkalicoccobacillus porphyridii]TSB44686.1 GNAT family N-acetyltransferase [Alkalicoccobacillus porphyridii]
MLIRELEKHDVSKLVPLLNQLGYPTDAEAVQKRFNTLLNHPDYHSLVMEQNDQLIGFAGLHNGLFYEANGQYIRVVAFVVDSEYRRMGLGQKLMAYIEGYAKEKGISTIVLNSGNREERKPAHAFYEQIGFTAKSTGFSKAL